MTYDIKTIQRHLNHKIVEKHQRWIKKMNNISLPVLWLSKKSYLLLNGHHRLMAAKEVGCTIRYYCVNKIRWVIHRKSLYTIFHELKNNKLKILDVTSTKPISRQNQMKQVRRYIKNCLYELNDKVASLPLATRYKIKQSKISTCKQLENILCMISDLS